MLRVLRGARSHSAIIVLLLVIAFAAYGMHQSTYFQGCFDRAAPTEPWTYAAVWLSCAADFIHEYHGPLTALGTILLALFTITLWWATFGLLRHAPKVERAYVFGGCGDQKDIIDPVTNAPARWVRATQGNYGKTPAFVEKIAVAHCLEKDLPARPQYINFFDVNEPLIPGAMGLPINRVEHTFPLMNGQIYYGRIYYRDIFGDSHYSSFIYRFDVNGRHEPVGIGDTKGMVHADYWKFD